MRHRKAGRRLCRTDGQRKAMLNNLAISLFENERIQTTLPTSPFTSSPMASPFRIPESGRRSSLSIPPIGSADLISGRRRMATAKTADSTR